MKQFFTLLFAASCLTAVGQSEYCLEGTVWDDELGGCVSVILNSADINNDGFVQLGDLLDLLTAYGDCGDEESAWQCGDPLEYQGYDYETVQIGEQCWFAENLRAENYRNGDAISADLSDSEWWDATTGAVAVYGEGSSLCYDAPCDPTQSLNEYGRLYNWYAVDDSRGLCPSGWHVPTDGEWITLEMGLGMGEAEAIDEFNYEWRGTDQGTQMKTAYGWSADGNGTNSSGFAGLPGGNRWGDGYFDDAGYSGYWWSSSTNGSQAWYRVLSSYYEGVYRSDLTHRNGFSIRCIKDVE